MNKFSLKDLVDLRKEIVKRTGMLDFDLAVTGGPCIRLVNGKTDSVDLLSFTVDRLLLEELEECLDTKIQLDVLTYKPGVTITCDDFDKYKLIATDYGSVPVSE